MAKIGRMSSPPVPFPTRPVDAYKGSFGTVLAVAGCRGMTGAGES